MRKKKRISNIRNWIFTIIGILISVSLYLIWRYMT